MGTKGQVDAEGRLSCEFAVNIDSIAFFVGGDSYYLAELKSQLCLSAVYLHVYVFHHGASVAHSLNGMSSVAH